MRYWAVMINNELDLIKDSMTNLKEEIRYIQVLDWDKINKCKFLSNMCKLHRFIHSKVIGVPKKYDDTILQDAEYPIYELFNIMQYSENVMKEFSDLLTTEIKLLKGLQKSDAERYKNLK